MVGARVNVGDRVGLLVTGDLVGLGVGDEVGFRVGFIVVGRLEGLYVGDMEVDGRDEDGSAVGEMATDG